MKTFGKVGDVQLKIVAPSDLCSDHGPDKRTWQLTLMGAGWDETFEMTSEGFHAPCNPGRAKAVVGDFNFDGQVDFAAPRDFSGPYGSGTYEVFLHEKASNRYRRAPYLSDLTVGNMGMFSIDQDARRLTTRSKSGCCLHYETEYEVLGNKVAPTRTITEGRKEWFGPNAPAPIGGDCVVVRVEEKPGQKPSRTERPCTDEER